MTITCNRSIYHGSREIDIPGTMVAGRAPWLLHRSSLPQLTAAATAHGIAERLPGRLATTASATQRHHRQRRLLAS